MITGYNSTWLIDSKLFDDPNYKFRKTWNSAPFGIQLGYKVNPSSTFQLQFFKNNMGAEYDIKGRNCVLCEDKTVGEKVVELEYWSLPLLYKFTAGDKVRFNFHFGPQFSFLSKGSEVNRFTDNAFLKVNMESTDLYYAEVAPATGVYWGHTKGEMVRAEKADFNKTDFGATFGLGLEADITNSLYFSANAKLYYGFNDVRGDDWVNYEKERHYYDSRNNVSGGFQLGLHYRFNL